MLADLRLGRQGNHKLPYRDCLWNLHRACTELQLAEIILRKAKVKYKTDSSDFGE